MKNSRSVIPSTKLKNGLLRSSVALMALAMSAPGYTQEKSSARVLEEVIVTATKREASLMEVPQSIQVLSGQMLEAQGINSLQGATQFVPSMSIPPSQGAGMPTYNLRGTGAQGSAGAAAVGFYIDDIPYAIPGLPFGPELDMYDLQSLQVLRGPQGTLYGQGSMGGTIVITSEKPDLERITGRARASGYSMEEGGSGYGADMTGSVPLIDNQLAVGITAGTKDVPGLAESSDFPGESNIDTQDHWYARVKARWEPSDDLSINAVYWRQKVDADFSEAIYTSVKPPQIEGTGGYRGGHDMKTDLAGVTAVWTTGIGTVTAISSYMSHYWDTDLGFAYDLGAPIGTQTLVQTVVLDSDSYNQELRLASNGDGPWNWLVGSSYSDGKKDAPNTLAIPALGIFQDAGVKTTTKQFSVFGELSRSFMDGKLTPLVGLRYFQDKREESQFSEGGLTSGPYAAELKEKYTSVSPRYNLSYTPSDDTTVYVNVARGFRSGVFNTPVAVAAGEFIGVDIPRVVDESEMWTYEVGARLLLLDGALLLEPSAYYNDWNSYQVYASVAGGPSAFPVDTVEGKGVEMLASWQTPVEGLSFNLMGSWNQTEPTKLDPELAAVLVSIQENQQLPYVPEWEYRVGASYERELGASGYTGFITGGYYQRDKQMDSQTTIFSDKVEDVSLRGGVRNDRWSVTLWADNLTDYKGPAIISGGLPQRVGRRVVGATVEFFAF